MNDDTSSTEITGLDEKRSQRRVTKAFCLGCDSANMPHATFHAGMYLIEPCLDGRRAPPAV